jgi:hypothetical protein
VATLILRLFEVGCSPGGTGGGGVVRVVELVDGEGIRWPMVSFRCPCGFTRGGDNLKHDMIEEKWPARGGHRAWGHGGAEDQWWGKL